MTKNILSVPKMLRLLGAFLLVSLLGGSLWVYHQWHQDDLPTLPMADLDFIQKPGKGKPAGGLTLSAYAASVLYMSGKSYWISPMDHTQKHPLQLGDLVGMPSYFEVMPQSYVQLTGSGLSIVALDGVPGVPSYFTLEGAWRSVDSALRVQRWKVGPGGMRVKFAENTTHTHWLEIVTPRVRLLLKQGEIGLQVFSAEGAGRFWLVSGSVIVNRKTEEGRWLPDRNEVTQKGIYEL